MRLFGTPAGTKIMLLTMLLVLVGLSYQVYVSFKLEKVGSPPSQVVIKDNRQFLLSARRFTAKNKAELREVPKTTSKDTQSSSAKAQTDRAKTSSQEAADNNNSVASSAPRPNNQDSPLRRVVKGVTSLLGL